MKTDIPIAVTSRSFSLNPILRAELLEKYSNVKFNDEGISLKGEKLIEYAKGKVKLITALETIDEKFLAALPELKVISKYGVGTDMLDKKALIKYGIKLGWQGGVNKRSVAELALTFMISLLHLVPQCNLELKNGQWKNQKGNCLTGKTVGIIGCGNIGKDLVYLLQPFGCRVLVNDIKSFPEFYSKYSLEAVELESLLEEADVVTLHVPLDNSTINLINKDRLNLLKSNSVLINTARGGLVDENTLKTKLEQNEIAGAGFDVFHVEPPINFDIVNLPNFLSTPHIGGSSKEAILAMGRAAIAGLDINRIPTKHYPPAG